MGCAGFLMSMEAIVPNLSSGWTTGGSLRATSWSCTWARGLSKVLLGPKARESWYMDWALVSLAMP